MFCVRCGAEIRKGENFCNQCGNPVTENPAAENPVPKNTETGNPVVPEGLAAVKPVIDKVGKKLESAKPVTGEMDKGQKTKLDKKKLAILGAAVVALVIIVLLKGRGGGGEAGSGFSSPEKAFDAWVEGFYLNDFDVTLQAYPDFAIEYEGGEAKLKEKLPKAYIEFSDMESYKFKYKAVGHTMFEEDRIGALERKLREELDAADVEISDGAIIHYEMVFLSDDGKEIESSSTSEHTCGYAFKYKGKWYFIYAGPVN